MYCSTKCGQRIRNKRHYRNNPEKILANRVRQNSDVARRILSRVKSRAKTSGIPFDLTVDDIVVPEKCPVLGLTLREQVGEGSGFHNASPSLDRIIPALGYVRGNVRVISARANLLKNNATSAELELVLADVRASGQ